MIFPWQQNQWVSLLRSYQLNRLPHALLLRGIKGLGKKEFATCITKLLLCDAQNDNENCTCKACHLIEAGTHPNILWVGPEKEGQVIKIDQIRNVVEFIQNTGLHKKQQIAIINPAHSMNTSAANALLKTLEEPPQHSLIILISDESNRLPATLLSRCQWLHFKVPAREQALSWLQKQNQENKNINLMLSLAQGAPLTALKHLESDYLLQRENLYHCLITCAQADQANIDSIFKMCEQKDTVLLLHLDLFYFWFMDLFRLKFMQTACIMNVDYLPHMNKIISKINAEALSELIWLVVQLRKQVLSGMNFNKQMLLENLFLKWLAIV